jgi:hypothetical protein
MLTVLMVLVAGTWHPTWAWIEDERYDKEKIFLTARSGLSANNACIMQRETMKTRFPKLKFECQRKL